MFNPEQNRLAPTLAMIMAASLVGFITGYTVPLISLSWRSSRLIPFTSACWPRYRQRG